MRIRTRSAVGTGRDEPFLPLGPETTARSVELLIYILHGVCVLVEWWCIRTISGPLYAQVTSRVDASVHDARRVLTRGCPTRLEPSRHLLVPCPLSAELQQDQAQLGAPPGELRRRDGRADVSMRSYRTPQQCQRADDTRPARGPPLGAQEPRSTEFEPGGPAFPHPTWPTPGR